MLSIHSQIGYKHEKNDDAILAMEGSDFSVLMICDGASSTARGGWIAQLTCHYVEYFVSTRGELKLEKLKEILVYVDWVARRLGRGQAACTLSIVCVQKNKGKAWIAALGDSPVLICSKERLEKKKLDWIVDKVKGSRLKDFIGMGDELLTSLKYTEVTIKKGDWILVMSDGVAEALRFEEFENGFRKREFKIIARELCELAKSHGSLDDLSVVSLAI